MTARDSARKKNPPSLSAPFRHPDQLWALYCAWKGLAPDQIELVLQDYYESGDDKSPRYYQCQAINSTIEAISKGSNRVLVDFERAVHELQAELYRKAAA